MADKFAREMKTKSREDETSFNIAASPRLSGALLQRWRVELVAITFQTAGMETEHERGKTGDPRENPPASSIVRHDSHLRKYGVTQPGIERGSPWWEASRLTAQPLPPPKLNVLAGPEARAIPSEWLERFQVRPQWLSGYKYMKWGCSGPVTRAILSGDAVAQ
ncbi:hypothetical protein PR048_008775 [Dryococelus australis]|uniref:Uncharacterized protein n=1 Tax=Dryococelus australis TaxID=614101 RepID=A0ABQ9HY23_9NEOP|nr:hypothetical protein PR048_008775 [Dryococelus australis]